MELKLNTAGTVADAGVTLQQPVSAKRERVLPEQMVYANLLDYGMKAGLAMLVVSFALYVLGIVEPHVPMADLPTYWSLPVSKYLEGTGVGTGWSWMAYAHKGDFMNFLGIAFLSGVTIICYLRILPFPFRSGDTLFSTILIAETLVLILGASGVLVVGH